QRRAAVGQEVSLLLGRQQVDLGRSGRDARARRVRRVHADERRQTRGGVRLRQVDGQVVAGDDLHAVERVGRGAAGGLDRRLDDHVLHAGGRDVDVVHAALAHGGATVAGDAARAEGIRGGRERAAVLVEALDGCGGDEVAEGVLHGDREVRQLADLDVRRVGGDVGATARGDGQGRRRALPVDREHHVARAARDEVADRRDAGRAVVRDVTRGGARGGVRGEDRAGDGDVLREVAAGTLGAGGARRAAHVAGRAARLAQGVLEERLAGDVQQDRLALETQGAARAGEDGDRRERVPAAVREGEVDARGGGGNKRGRAGVLRVARRVVADGQAEGVRAAQPEAGAGHEVDAAGVLVDAEGLGQDARDVARAAGAGDPDGVVGVEALEVRAAGDRELAHGERERAAGRAGHVEDRPGGEGHRGVELRGVREEARAQRRAGRGLHAGEGEAAGRVLRGLELGRERHVVLEARVRRRRVLVDRQGRGADGQVVLAEDVAARADGVARGARARHRVGDGRVHEEVVHVGVGRAGLEDRGRAVRLGRDAVGQAGARGEDVDDRAGDGGAVRRVGRREDVVERARRVVDDARLAQGDRDLGVGRDDELG